MVHLEVLRWKTGQAPDEAGFPFAIAAVRSLEALTFDSAVAFFVGDNGSGKSTLLEAIAVAANLPTVGARDSRRDETLAAQRRLADALRLVWTKRATRGFFLRAEDFFGYVQRLATERVGLETRLDELEAEYLERGRSAYALGLAQGPMRSSLAEMTRRYGTDLDANSHGQGFLRLFRARFVPEGLHLLDEPEAALSPQSQLALLATLIDMTARGAQFIVATHSPILLGYPGAQIVSFDQTPPAVVEYESLDHVRITRDFLNDRERFLRHLRDG